MTGRDLPILFSPAMVRALLAGTKTQTRRLLRLPRGVDREHFSVSSTWIDPKRGVRFVHWPADTAVEAFQRQPYAPGDRLYVREHWRADCQYDDTSPRDMGFDEVQIRYEADGAWNDHDAMTSAPGRHRQAMHMPRWASRITLKVTDARVQRLQDISETDASAEGIEFDGVQYYLPNAPSRATARESYADLINGLHGDFLWEANPFVAAYTFTVALGNIDQIARAA